MRAYHRRCHRRAASRCPSGYRAQYSRVYTDRYQRTRSSQSRRPNLHRCRCTLHVRQTNINHAHNRRKRQYNSSYTRPFAYINTTRYRRSSKRHPSLPSHPRATTPTSTHRASSNSVALSRSTRLYRTQTPRLHPLEMSRGDDDMLRRMFANFVERKIHPGSAPGGPGPRSPSASSSAHAPQHHQHGHGSSSSHQQHPASVRRTASAHPTTGPPHHLATSASPSSSHHQHYGHEGSYHVSPPSSGYPGGGSGGGGSSGAPPGGSSSYHHHHQQQAHPHRRGAAGAGVAAMASGSASGSGTSAGSSVGVSKSLASLLSPSAGPSSGPSTGLPGSHHAQHGHYMGAGGSGAGGGSGHASSHGSGHGHGYPHAHGSSRPRAGNSGSLVDGVNPSDDTSGAARPPRKRTRPNPAQLARTRSAHSSLPMGSGPPGSAMVGGGSTAPSGGPGAWSGVGPPPPSAAPGTRPSGSRSSQASGVGSPSSHHRSSSSAGSSHARSQSSSQQQRSFPCSDCDAVFAQRGQLSRHHRRVHERLRPHACEYCGRLFGARSDRTRHVQVCIAVSLSLDAHRARARWLLHHGMRYTNVRKHPSGDLTMSRSTCYFVYSHVFTRRVHRRRAYWSLMRCRARRLCTRKYVLLTRSCGIELPAGTLSRRSTL